jgi:hypothetical protein
MNSEIREFEWDEGTGRNVDHIALHEVTPADVEEVLDNAPRFARSNRDEGATHFMLGPTKAGRFLFAAIVETPITGRWYVVTAYWMSRTRADRIYNRWA